VNHCVLYDETPKIKGMLKKGKDYITWGEVSEEILTRLFKKRAYVYNEDNKLVKLNIVYKDVDKVVKELMEGKTTIKKLKIKPVFRLKPPTKGFERKGVKQTYMQGGVLGYRAQEINPLLKKML
jgi:large subunit ribosomal protein L30